MIFRELKLQQDRLARRQEQQRRAEKDNEDFLAQIGEEISRKYTGHSCPSKSSNAEQRRTMRTSWLRWWGNLWKGYGAFLL